MDDSGPGAWQPWRRNATAPDGVLPGVSSRPLPRAGSSPRPGTDRPPARAARRPPRTGGFRAWP